MSSHCLENFDSPIAWRILISLSDNDTWNSSWEIVWAFVLLYFLWTLVLLILQCWIEWEFSVLGERLHLFLSCIPGMGPTFFHFLELENVLEEIVQLKLIGAFECFFSLYPPIFVCFQSLWLLDFDIFKLQITFAPSIVVKGSPLGAQHDLTGIPVILHFLPCFSSYICQM